MEAKTIEHHIIEPELDELVEDEDDFIFMVNFRRNNNVNKKDS